MEMPPDRSRLLTEIDFDDTVEPVRSGLRGKTGDPTTEKMNLRSGVRVKTEEPMNSTPNLLESVGGLLRNRPTPMKPGKFDGTGSLESFLVQFEV